jgi:hypothetical protein
MYESAIRFALHIIGDKKLTAKFGSPCVASPDIFRIGIPKFHGTILILPYKSARKVKKKCNRP